MLPFNLLPSGSTFFGSGRGQQPQGQRFDNRPTPNSQVRTIAFMNLVPGLLLRLYLDILVHASVNFHVFVSVQKCAPVLMFVPVYASEHAHVSVHVPKLYCTCLFYLFLHL